MSKQIKTAHAPILRILWKQWDAIFYGVLGILLSLVWAIYPVPDLRDLTEVEAPLWSYSIERDQSPWRGRGGNKPYVIFSVSHYEGRFWTEAVTPENAKAVLPRRGMMLKFHRRTDPNAASPINGDAVKSYGLSVDGVMIKSVEDALGSDRFFKMLLSFMGLIPLAMAAYKWRKNNSDGA